MRPPRSGKEYAHECDICKSYRGKKVKVTKPDEQVVEGFLCDLCLRAMPEGFEVKIIES